MSLDTCSTCKYCVYCETSRGQVTTECRGYESLDSAAAYEWDLRDLMKLWTTVEERVPTE